MVPKRSRRSAAPSRPAAHAAHAAQKQPPESTDSDGPDEQLITDLLGTINESDDDVALKPALDDGRRSANRKRSPPGIAAAPSRNKMARLSNSNIDHDDRKRLARPPRTSYGARGRNATGEEIYDFPKSPAQPAPHSRTSSVNNTTGEEIHDSPPSPSRSGRSVRGPRARRSARTDVRVEMPPPPRSARATFSPSTSDGGDIFDYHPSLPQTTPTRPTPRATRRATRDERSLEQAEPYEQIGLNEHAGHNAHMEQVESAMKKMDHHDTIEGTGRDLFVSWDGPPVEGALSTSRRGRLRTVTPFDVTQDYRDKARGSASRRRTSILGFIDINAHSEGSDDAQGIESLTTVLRKAEEVTGGETTERKLTERAPVIEERAKKKPTVAEDEGGSVYEEDPDHRESSSDETDTEAQETFLRCFRQDKDEEIEGLMNEEPTAGADNEPTEEEEQPVAEYDPNFDGVVLDNNNTRGQETLVEPPKEMDGLANEEQMVEVEDEPAGEENDKEGSNHEDNHDYQDSDSENDRAGRPEVLVEISVESPNKVEKEMGEEMEDTADEAPIVQAGVEKESEYEDDEDREESDLDDDSDTDEAFNSDKELFELAISVDRPKEYWTTVLSEARELHDKYKSFDSSKVKDVLKSIATARVVYDEIIEYANSSANPNDVEESSSNRHEQHAKSVLESTTCVKDVAKATRGLQPPDDDTALHKQVYAHVIPQLVRLLRICLRAHYREYNDDTPVSLTGLDQLRVLFSTLVALCAPRRFDGKGICQRHIQAIRTRAQLVCNVIEKRLQYWEKRDREERRREAETLAREAREREERQRRQMRQRQSEAEARRHPGLVAPRRTDGSSLANQRSSTVDNGQADWTDEQGEALVDGLRMFQGQDRYRKIMEHFKLKLRGRTIQDAREMARTIKLGNQTRARQDISRGRNPKEWEWLFSI